MNPEAALIVKSGGTIISANVRVGALSHKTDQLKYFCRFYISKVSQTCVNWDWADLERLSL